MSVAEFNRVVLLLADLRSSLDSVSVEVMRFDRRFTAAAGDVVLPASAARDLRQLAALSRQLLRTVPIEAPLSSPNIE